MSSGRLARFFDGHGFTKSQRSACAGLYCDLIMHGVGGNDGGAKREVFENSRIAVSLIMVSTPMTVQIFGLKNSAATRAAERFFKERRVVFQFVDLKRKPMSPAEIKRFVDRFALAGLLDSEGKVYNDAGLKYLRLTDADLLKRIEQEAGLLRLPLVRAGNRLSIGADENAWKDMLAGVP